jgi:hypothetical protein
LAAVFASLAIWACGFYEVISIVCEECGFIWARSGNYRGFQSLGPARSLSQTNGTILRRLQGDVPKAVIVTSQVMWCDVGYRYTSIAECPMSIGK